MYMSERFAAVVPAYNAAAALPALLADLKKQIAADSIVVVDDGSIDDTAAVAEREGVRVLRHPVNRGKGSAVRTGFAYLLTLPDVEAVFMLDADGQHDPAEIPRFVEAYREQAADLIIGSRMAEHSSMPRLRRATNRLTSGITGLLAGCRIDDSQSGYRLIRASLLRRLTLVTSRYEIESEMIIKACRAHAKVASVPIRTIYAQEKSAINPLRDAFRFFLLVIRSFFW
jgi:glycosyltransferase involved in cell wall biosynthesis